VDGMLTFWTGFTSQEDIHKGPKKRMDFLPVSSGSWLGERSANSFVA